MPSHATLHFFCGKPGAGKTTRAQALARQHRAILLSEDVWLSRLYGEQIQVFDDYIRFSQKLQAAIQPLVIDLLAAGQSVVMDFQGNTRRRREWFRSMFEAAQAAHVLHVIETSDQLCLERIAKRNIERPEGASHLTEADFRFVSSFFEAPHASEGFYLAM